MQTVPGVPLVLVESPYRALIAPVVAYLDVLDRSRTDSLEAPITFVLIPEYVAAALVGTDALQPGRQAASGGPAGPTAYGSDQHPVPARRGPGAGRRSRIAAGRYARAGGQRPAP